ncbi:MAG: AAA family ATPase [Plesiomonas shigelloides]|jgi:predicted ATP-dependent endonuclease of OLD family
MKIDYVELRQYRNFANARINLAKNSLVIGSNDVGKTNMIHALRLLLDKSLSTPISNHRSMTSTAIKTARRLIRFQSELPSPK